MSTNGIIGVHICGQDKIAYNHSSSYPAWLGKQLVNDLHELLTNRPALEKAAMELRAVPPDSKPDSTQWEKLRQYHRNGCGATDEDWYRLLRETQGSLKETLRAGLYQEEKAFARDSVFCEWGYIANLDRNMLEVYRGYQTKKHDKGRLAALGRQGPRNYPIALVGEVPFAVIQTDPDLAFKYLEAMSSGPPKKPATHVERLQARSAHGIAR